MKVQLTVEVNTLDAPYKLDAAGVKTIVHTALARELGIGGTIADFRIDVIEEN